MVILGGVEELKMHRRKGFSLVELLVVIGIIAALIALLLPSVRRAKEYANMMVCQSHLRLLDQAFLMYTQNNGDKFPRPAADVQFEDWIYWQSNRNQNQGRIQLYMGNQFDPALYTCPSDDPNSHPGGYPYSYSVNFCLCAYDGSASNPPLPPLLPSVYPTQSRSRGAIVDPSHCILIIDESPQTIDDGCWAWQGSYGQDPPGGGQANVMANRHDKFNAEAINNPNDPNSGRGNAAFCDGHVELVPRVDSWIQSFWDPTYKDVHGGSE
jgi:prepilin-type N-terminal cleavage/methylation domain-containing protein/prepilin-type processing-associated H-X9-DG protein